MGSEGLRPMDRSARLDRLRTALATSGAAVEATVESAMETAVEIEALVVTKPESIRWLTGFTGSSGMVVVTGDALTLVTDDRYTTMASEQLEAAGVTARVVIDRDPSDPIVAAVGSARSVGLEAGHITWDRARQIMDWIGERQPVPTVGLIEELRKDKDPGEVDRLALAASIADAALAEVAPGIVPGRSERSLAIALERAMIDLGADGLSFPTIVAAGPNGAKPHAVPSERPVAPGDPVVIDFGASVDGYGSDMTRTFLVEPVDPVGLERYRAVEEAQAAGVAAVAGGVEERAVDEACRSALADRELAEAFTHGTGHGIGLEIHEQPFLSPRSTGILRSGFVVTVEPGVYLPEWGGVRIEDSVVVTDRACEALTRFPKDHRVPG